MKKFIGLDVGDVRIGVAKCDPLGILATALEVIDRTKTNSVERIKEILDDEGTKKVVVGMPKSLDGIPTTTLGGKSRGICGRIEKEYSKYSDYLCG